MDSLTDSLMGSLTCSEAGSQTVNPHGARPPGRAGEAA